MKKEYSAPNVELVSVQLHSMIAQSPTSFYDCQTKDAFSMGFSNEAYSDEFQSRGSDGLWSEDEE